MEFDEILKIDRNPFHMDALSDFCNPHYHATTRLLPAYQSLKDRYFQEFARRYGIDYAPIASNSVPPNYLCCNENEAWEDYLYEAEYCLENENWNLLRSLLEPCGWKIYVFNTEECFGEDNPTDAAAEQMADLLVDFIEGGDESDKAMFLDGMTVIRDVSYLEDGTLFFLWNPTLAEYLHLQKRFRGWIRRTLPLEYKEINKVMGEIQFPLVYRCEFVAGLLSDRYYLAFDMGSNGYERLSCLSLNYNAVISFFVLDLLLKNIKGKLRDFKAMEPIH